MDATEADAKIPQLIVSDELVITEHCTSAIDVKALSKFGNAHRATP